MANNEKRDLTKAEIDAAVERMNREAGYDVAVAYAMLTAVGVMEQGEVEGVPRAVVEQDMVAIADVVSRANGGVIGGHALGVLMELMMGYGWHWAKEGESLIRSERVVELVREKFENGRGGEMRKRELGGEAVERGVEAVRKAVAVATKSVALRREMGRRGK